MITIFTFYLTFWKQFTIGINIISIIYYVVVTILYYIDKIKQLPGGEVSIFSRLSNKPKFSAHKPGKDIQSSVDVDLFYMFEQLVNRFKKLNERASNLNSSKGDPMFALRHILTSSMHASLNYYFLRSEINELIDAECEKSILFN